jgi:membrane associated rhomboid family serine protease
MYLAKPSSERQETSMQADPQDPLPSKAAHAGYRASLVLLGLIGLSSGVELILIAADHGLIGTPRWRGLAYQNGAFWAGLLYNWQPNYDAQPWLMFVTYAFLHTGFGHLAGNMLTLFFLGRIVQERVGQRGLAALYAVSAIGGAAAFAAMNSSPQPMVGASGALFGLAGAWQYWEWRARVRAARHTWPVWRMVLGLVALNVVLWWWQDGRLAWETHLGGFIAGWVGAVVLRRMGKG